MLSAGGMATPGFLLYRPAGSASPASTAGPAGVTPSQMRTAYGFNSILFGSLTGDGTGQTIAIVDAYNDPGIISDTAAFNSYFGLQQFNVTGGPTLTVVGQDGSSNLPGTDPAGPGNSWAVEISLDVQWAHVVAPMANILLVEANDNSNTSLFTAVTTAANYGGVSAVSMSWAGSEYRGENTYDSTFTTPSGHNGVSFFAATGDSGGYTNVTVYPAASPNVVAVGGTTLYLGSGGTYASESGWSGSGGGISRYESQPSYQSGVVTQSTTKRTIPDVAMDADPNSGVPVYDTWDYGTSKPWQQVGGTSLATPLWAGLTALVDQDRVLYGLDTLTSTQMLNSLYSLYTTAPGDFHDITTGNNVVYSAGPGYDLVTGLGTPVANLLVPDLAAIPFASVANQFIFYNNSAFDGNNPAANIADDAAIATDKTALLPGQTATFANYTSYSRGINGLMVDMTGLLGTPSASDFVLKVGNTSDPSTWATYNGGLNVSVRTGAGTGGSTRITLTMPDGAITEEWVQVTVLSNSNGGHLGLEANDVFYFGNLIASTGASNTSTLARISSADVIQTQNNAVLGSVAITNNYDFNRDGHVSSADVIICRVNAILGGLPLFSAPPAPASASVTATMASASATSGSFLPAIESQITYKSPVVSTVSIRNPGGTIVPGVPAEMLQHSNLLSENSLTLGYPGVSFMTIGMAPSIGESKWLETNSLVWYMPIWQQWLWWPYWRAPVKRV